MQLAEKLKMLPAKPGVYLYRDQGGQVIYVGKAVSLKHRVRSYFLAGEQQAPRTKLMLEKMVDFDFIVTDSEVEALILEQNLIKEHRPKYNVKLKDDKSYPYLKVTINENYPRVFTTRRKLKDGARYFGPYAKVGAVNETLSLLKRIFPFRTCKQRETPTRERPCLNHYIKRCLGPCCGLTNRADYLAMIGEVCLFLEGRQESLSKQLNARMEEAAGKLDYELAARLRDQLQSVREVSEKQKVISDNFSEHDVLALARDANEACVMMFFVRSGKLVGREQFILKDSEGLENPAILQAFIKQYYSEADYLPKELLLSEPTGDEQMVIEEWLTGRKGGKVTLKTPRRGEKKHLVDLAAKNAQLALEQAQNESNAVRRRLTEALTELTAALGLAETPFRLECYDISNTQGADSVASMVVFEEGKPAREQYRRFKIRTVTGPDDYASMQEVLRRRFTRALAERELINTGQLSSREAKFSRLPDLLIVDGGKGQLSAARQVMRELGFAQIPTFGLAKEEELLFQEGREAPLILPRDSQGLYLLQRLRDEAHRFAITYHRQVRGKTGLRSQLDEIEGVGAARRSALLKAFGSVKLIAKASLEELTAVKGMNKATAKKIYDYFHA